MVAPIFGPVQMLADRLELHGPECPGGAACGCGPILDVEKFVEALIQRHFIGGGGKRRDDGSYTGAAHLTRADLEDLRAYLIGEAWEASRRFNHNGRLNGYVLWILHRRCVDWQRKRFGSTRYGGPKSRPRRV